MRYPTNNFKTEWNTTAGYGFGNKVSYGFHEGVDINLNGAGDSDLGKEIFAIANGELVYWHGAKHPATGFGYHSVYKITGPWGTRWIHEAHCLPDITPAPRLIKENEVIAHAGKSGTQFVHIHFSIFKVDPATLPNGIDTVANTQQQLNDWWEDPIAFIEKWMKTLEPMATITQKELNSIIAARDENWNRYNEALKKIEELSKRPESCPPVNPIYKETLQKFKQLLDGVQL